MDASNEEAFYDDDEPVGVRVELRDDRLLLFVDELSRTFEWTCSMRAVTAGRFFLPPVVAEGMYAPGLQSVGASSIVSIVSK